jgi:anti-sigma-K factor RskA
MKIEQAEHLSSDALVALLYEAAPAPASANAHLACCPHCQARLRTMETRRSADAGQLTLAPSKLAAQRANIYSRLDNRSPFGSRWLWAGAPMAAAAALLVMVNVGTFQTEPAAPAQVANAQAVESDTLYADIYQTLSQEAPSGVYTVAGMFDVAQQESAATKN